MVCTIVLKKLHDLHVCTSSVTSSFEFGRFKRANHSQLRFRYASLINAPRPPILQTPEEIHVRKLLHLVDIGSLCDLLVVEENPCRVLFVG